MVKVSLIIYSEGTEVRHFDCVEAYNVARARYATRVPGAENALYKLLNRQERVEQIFSDIYCLSLEQTENACLILGGESEAWKLLGDSSSRINICGAGHHAVIQIRREPDRFVTIATIYQTQNYKIYNSVTSRHLNGLSYMGYEVELMDRSTYLDDTDGPGRKRPRNNTDG